MKRTATKQATTKRLTAREKSEKGSDAAPQPATVEIERYNKLVAATELLGLQLIRSKADLFPERLPDDGDLVLRVKSPQFRGEYVDESRTLSCGVRLTLVLEPATAKDSSVLEVFAEYNVTYRLRDSAECAADIAHLFAGRNAVFNVWPFFRELAFSLVAKMGMPPLVLPLFRMPLLPKVGAH
ncbi:hypothetical protein [Sorangium cellulosum]|uniref:hypothetical protein n=1 Tax=Sorangium cellulosum TaxID=56 RepID=UPI000AFA4CBF|nr:hypothetical protein [Sorangium cellulosum]